MIPQTPNGGPVRDDAIPGASSPGEAPVVTVVITGHNHGRFLRDAVGSVRRQTFTDLELIVVDDGSTDDTPAVAADLPGIRYIRQEHAGLSAARNTGWRASRGRYVSFLDADDRLFPHAIHVGVRCAAAHPDAAFVSGHFVVIDAAGVQISDRHRPCVTSDHYQALLRANYIGMHAAVLYRRETLERHDGFDPSLPACEDFDLYLRVARQAPIVCHPEVVAEYRWHGANMSLDSALMLTTTLQVLGRQREHVRGNAHLEAAYREGVAFWQRLYGDPLLGEVATRVRTGASWSKTARLLLVLLRHYPVGLAGRTLRFTKRWLAGRVLPG
jgi:glycosyltransferase involved in cell wall biosynthesis